MATTTVKNEKKPAILMSKKKLIINICIILVVTGLTVYTLIKSGLFSQDENTGKTIFDALSNVKWYDVLIILAIVAVYVFAECWIYYRQFRRVNPKMSYGDCIGTYMYANLGTNITPAKVGHHPFRIYYLERKGNTFAQSIANATQCQIIYTVVQVILYGIMTIVCAIKGITVTIYGTTVPMYLVGLIGIGMAFIASGVFVIMAFVPPIGKLMVHILAWFNLKMKKVKTKEEYISSQEEKLKILREQIILMFTHFWETLPSLLIYLVEIVANNCLPYFIFLIISKDVPFDFGTMCYYFALYQCISYISNIVPIPGNSGGAELLFSTLFSAVILDSSVLKATLLLWRFSSYYLLLFIEVIYFIASTVTIDAKKEIQLHNILNETKKGWTPEVHSHFDTMEMELLSVNFKNTQCYNCCHLQNNLFQCDKYKDKPNEILQNKVRCPFYHERDNGEDL